MNATVGIPALSGPVDLILFDAVGTLIQPIPAVDEVYYNAAQGFPGLTLSRDMIRARFREALHASAHKHLTDRAGRTSEEVERNRWSAIVGQVFAEAGDIISEVIFTRLWQHFSEPEHWQVFPDVAPTIEELRRRDYQIGIASNFDQRLLSICRGHETLADLNPVFVSSQVGWSKPAPEFYRQMEAVTGLPPQRIMLVGDDWKNDVNAPRIAGWQARWLVREPATAQPATIATLTELLAELP